VVDQEPQHEEDTRTSKANNPLFAGPNADVLALIPFVGLALVLYLVGRGALLAPRRS
jgi:hypothetical protein